MKNSLDFAKHILKAVHDDFVENGKDNSVYIPLVKRIILEVQSYLGEQEESIEEELKVYAFSLFWETWIYFTEEFEDSYDLDEERRRAEDTFFTIYDQS